MVIEAEAGARVKVYGNDDEDVLVGGFTSSDLISGGADNGLISGEDGFNSLAGGSGSDSILGGLDADIIRGNSGDDFLIGEDGADTLVGGSGQDVIVAGDIDFSGIPVIGDPIMVTAGGATWLDDIAATVSADGEQDWIVFGGDLDDKNYYASRPVENTDNGVDTIYGLDLCNDGIGVDGDVLDLSRMFKDVLTITPENVGDYVWLEMVDAERSDLYIDTLGGGEAIGNGVLMAHLEGVADGAEVTVRVNATLTTCIASDPLTESLYYTVGYYSAGSAGIWLEGEGGETGYAPGIDTLLEVGSGGLTLNGVLGSGGSLSIDGADFANNEVTIEWQLITFPTLDVSGFNSNDKIVLNLSQNASTWGGAATFLGYGASSLPPTKVGSFAAFSSTASTKNYRRLSRSVHHSTAIGISTFSTGNVLVRGQADVNSGHTKLLARGLASGSYKIFTTSPTTNQVGAGPISTSTSATLAVGFNPATLTSSQFSFIVPTLPS